MAFLHTDTASPATETSRLAALRSVSNGTMFCYVAFALSFGFSAAVLLGFVS